MLIVDKERTSVANTLFVTGLYVSLNDLTIKANMANGSMMRLGRYSTVAEAETAFEVLVKNLALNRQEVCYIPTDNEIRGLIATEGHGKTVPHTVTGKKAKSHGGS